MEKTQQSTEVKLFSGLYFGDDVVFYGIPKNERLLILLNQVNKVFGELRVKTVFKLKEELGKIYGEEIGNKMLHNAKMIYEHTMLKDMPLYAELGKCLAEGYRYDMECMIRDVIVHYISSTSYKLDYVFIKYTYNEEGSQVYKGRGYKGYLMCDYEQDLHSELNKQLAKKLDNVRALVKKYTQKELCTIDIAYNMQESDVNCVMGYDEEEMDGKEWFSGVREKYHLK